MAANVPIVFAINKIDKPAANPDKIKEHLANMNFLVEDWGGKYQSQDISAKKGIGVKELLEKVLLEAEMLDLKANPNRKGTGTVIESSLDKGRGYVATVLCSNGTLRVGDIMLAGTSYGRVKAMFNERGQRVKEIGPSQAATILGLNGAPTAGDAFHVMDSDQEAREIANKREQLAREQGLRTMKRVDLNEIGRRIALGNFKELNIIVKGDVDGSIEALSDSLLKLSTEKIQVNVIQKSVGQPLASWQNRKAWTSAPTVSSMTPLRKCAMPWKVCFRPKSRRKLQPRWRCVRFTTSQRLEPWQVPTSSRARSAAPTRHVSSATVSWCSQAKSMP